MQEIRSSNSPVVTGICGTDKSQARHHCTILNTILYFLLRNTQQVYTMCGTFPFVNTILLYNIIHGITYLNNPKFTTTYCYLLFKIGLVNCIFLLFCLSSWDLKRGCLKPCFILCVLLGNFEILNVFHV